ncbi:MAG: hypothetical protein MI674_07365 [Cytophagales bacterium]|nr:hypothetical protein [Cytophagales bacterium]
MSFRIKNLLIVLITFLATIGACSRKAASVSGGQPSNTEQLMVGKIIQLLIEGKSDELNEIISKPPESPGDTLSELLGAVGKRIPNNTDPNQLLLEVVTHCAGGNEVLALSAILADAGAKSQLTSDNIKASLDAAAAAGHDKAVKVILAQAQDKITPTALQGTFSTAAGEDDKAPIVTAILSNAQAQEKVGDTAIANALKKASENNYTKVKEAILAYWDVKQAFKKAVDEGDATSVDELLSNAEEKAEIGSQAIQEGLKEAANAEPPKTAVIGAILNNLSADELGQALQQAASQGDDKVVAAILEGLGNDPDKIATILHSAKKNSNDDAVKAILEGLDDDKKVALLDSAKKNSNDDAVKAILEELGNDPDNTATILEGAKKDNKYPNAAVAILARLGGDPDNTAAVLDSANKNSKKEAEKAIVDKLAEDTKELVSVLDAANKEDKYPGATEAIVGELVRDTDDKADKLVSILDAAKKYNKSDATKAIVDKLGENSAFLIKTFTSAVSKGRVSVVEEILTNPKTKEKIDASTLGEQLQKAADDNRANVAEAILKDADKSKLNSELIIKALKAAGDDSVFRSIFIAVVKEGYEKAVVDAILADGDLKGRLKKEYIENAITVANNSDVKQALQDYLATLP